MSDSFDSFSNLDSKDKDLQEFLMVEKQKAQFNAQVNLSGTCRMLSKTHNFFEIFRYTNLVISVGTDVWISLQVNWMLKPKHV